MSLFSLLRMVVFMGFGVLPLHAELLHAEDAAPRDIRLVEKTFEALSDRNISDLGKKALEIAPTKWKHAETENFIIHYRRQTEAQRVVPEIEYNVWYVAKVLNASKTTYATKSHVYVFQDEDEWKDFLFEIKLQNWVGSFANKDDLFLHVGGMGEEFDSHTLAHETTHALVYRIYHGATWPMWLNEGFAEYMGSASIAARKGLFLPGLEKNLPYAAIPLEALEAIKQYPNDTVQVVALYQTGEKLVRFLMTQFPKDRITRFIDATMAGKDIKTAVLQVYGDKAPDFNAFKKRYAQFKK